MLEKALESPLDSPGNSSQAWERRTNQNSTPNPSPEGDQSDPETPVFLNFSRDNTLYKQCNPELRAPPYSCCVVIGVGGSPSLSLVIKTLLLLHQISAPWWYWEISRLGHNIWGLDRDLPPAPWEDRSRESSTANKLFFFLSFCF